MRHLFVLPVVLFLAASCGQRGIEKKEEPSAMKDRTAWRKLSRGMPPDKVRQLLGEPFHIDDQQGAMCWFYGGRGALSKDDSNAWVYPRGSVLFIRKGAGGAKVNNWREP
jgi:hypothetical protein